MIVNLDTTKESPPEKKIAKGFRLTKENCEKLRKLAKDTNLSENEIVNRLIRDATVGG